MVILRERSDKYEKFPSVAKILKTVTNYKKAAIISYNLLLWIYIAFTNTKTHRKNFRER